MNEMIERWRGGLIVSCQAPASSPLAKSKIIAAFAETAEQNGAVGVRIDSPENVAAVKAKVKIPILGIYKKVSSESEVYITPTLEAARAIAAAGADVIALDATFRRRPRGEKFTDIAEFIRSQLNKLILADISTFDEGLSAAEKTGVDFIATTLAGYTPETKHLADADYELVERLALKTTVPVICEGRLRSPADVRRAFDCGAFAVVVGGAITGINQLVEQFAAASPLGKRLER